MTDIQAKIAEKHERTILSRAFHARADKDKIATWQQEFKTILEIFNVCSIDSIWHRLMAVLQTGLAVNTNAMIADIRRLIKEGTQIHKLVSRPRSSSQKPLTIPQDWRARLVAIAAMRSRL